MEVRYNISKNKQNNNNINSENKNCSENFIEYLTHNGSRITKCVGTQNFFQGF